MPDENALISLNKLTVRRSGQPLLADVTYALHQGECWAVVGPTGSGKTSFLRAMAGQFPARPGSLFRRAPPNLSRLKKSRVAFRTAVISTSNDIRPRWVTAPKAQHRLITRFRRCVIFWGLQNPQNSTLISRLGLEPLLDRSFLKLSNGQTRKARIGKALLRHPSILLLDNPFVGLDKGFRAELITWLGELTEHGLALVLVTEPDQIPPFVTHVLSLDKGQVQWQGVRESYVHEHQYESASTMSALHTKPQRIDFTEAFRLRHVTVRYGDTVILNDVNWVVRAGERWALLGSNGAGKSVLLSLLYGDHPQAYANNVSVFGHRRGKSGESIWDVKRRIGFVSPELHLYFPQHLSVRQVALTGLTDTLTPPKRVSPDIEADLSQLLAYFDLTHTLHRSFGTLSAGEQRLVLLIRALLKNPSVLLLDEPFQVIDARYAELARQLIDSLTDKTILFITHNRGELPETIDQIFELTTSL